MMQGDTHFPESSKPSLQTSILIPVGSAYSAMALVKNGLLDRGSFTTIAGTHDGYCFLPKSIIGQVESLEANHIKWNSTS